MDSQWLMQFELNVFRDIGEEDQIHFHLHHANAACLWPNWAIFFNRYFTIWHDPDVLAYTLDIGSRWFYWGNINSD